MSWIAEWIEKRRIRKMEERRRLAEARARDAVQIREFCGGIYLSYNDVPTVPVDMLGKDVTEVLDAAREAYAKYFARSD